MGKIRNWQPVKLFIGFIFKEGPAFEKAKAILRRQFGKIDFESQAFIFKHTDYYREEFGPGLKKQFLSFKELIPPDRLARIKIQTNKIEKKLSKGGRRSVNIDPGYLNFSKVILASTKDYSHRIALGGGINAEITLLYQNKTFQPLEWTYPDYRTDEYLEVFRQMREIYARQI
ncbi:DUF4416 family protein [bacterium]|nr:MAG: DUF4416 family protein [bacterium]